MPCLSVQIGDEHLFNGQRDFLKGVIMKHSNLGNEWMTTQLPWDWDINGFT